MLKEFLWPQVLRTAEYEKYYFQQDGARPHTATTLQTWLGDKFKAKLVHKDSCPPRSSDPNPCDSILWGHLKSKVYDPLPKILDDLKANIEREIKKFSKLFLILHFVNLKKRCELII
jgi:hypothetical protein